MNRIIIKNNTDLSDQDILLVVHKVMQSGLISGDGTSYCYCNHVVVNKENYTVFADTTKTGHKFTIFNLHV